MRSKILLGVGIVVALAFAANEFMQRPIGNATHAAANLLINGDFRKNTNPWRIHSSWPVAWSGAEGEGSVRVAATSESGGRGRQVLSQCVSVSGEQSFELGARFKKDLRSTQKGSGRLRVSWHEQADCNGAATIEPGTTSVQEISGWQQLRTGVLKAPPGTRSVNVSIIQAVDGTGQFVANWDDLYLNASR